MEIQLMLPIFEPIEVFDVPSEHQSRQPQPKPADLAAITLDSNKMKKAAEHWQEQYGNEIPF